MRKKANIILAIVALIALSGCRSGYRLYTAAILDRVPGSDWGTLEIAESLRAFGVEVVSEDSALSVLEPTFFRAQSHKLCASDRADRVFAAVAIGEKLGVDAIVYSAVSRKGVKQMDATPCMVEDLVALYLVSPPTVLVEAKGYDDFIARLALLDWERIVKPLPPPDTFIVALDEKIKYADVELMVVASTGASVGEGVSEKATNDDDYRGERTVAGQSQVEKGDIYSSAQSSYNADNDNVAKGDARQSKAQETAAGTEFDKTAESKTEKLETASEGRGAGRWTLIIGDGYHEHSRTNFDTDISGIIKNRLDYKVRAELTGGEPVFVFVLVDLRLD